MIDISYESTIDHSITSLAVIEPVLIHSLMNRVNIYTYIGSCVCVCVCVCV